MPIENKPATPATAAEELDSVLHWRNKHAIVIKERDALQQRLNAADQRIDELTAKPSDAERDRLRAIIEKYPNGDPLEYDAAVRAIRQKSL
jgi:hypothetical protein